METASLPYCRCCHKDINPDDAFCGHCGYPIKGTEQEQYKHIATFVMKKGDINEAGNLVRQARNSLIAVAFLTAIGGLLMNALSGGNNSADVVITMVLGGVFGLLAWWSNQNPFAALLTGLIIYGSLMVLGLMSADASFFKGILIKIVIIVLLVRGVIGASRLKGKNDNGR